MSGKYRTPSNMQTVNVEIESYQLDTRTWTRDLSVIHHATKSFANGGMRRAYKAFNCKMENWESHPMVLKLPIESDLQTEDLVRTQVQMQAKCVRYAEQYNAETRTPKKVNYVPCYLVKFLSGRWEGMFGCIEEYIGDHFVKHNVVNPLYDGYALTERNTPQAFSHFTFEKSNKTEIVVDVQGVGDSYTDPQLYSVSLNGPLPPYGPADWGVMGVANFFKNHRCNAICSSLGYGSRSTKPGSSLGTQPKFVQTM